MRALFILLLLSLALFMWTVNAYAHQRGCSTPKCKRQVVEPYRDTLKARAHCESTNRRTAHSPGGQYHGLYQFGLPDWRRAGGWGDPHNASRLEQSFRAVVWQRRHGGDPWPNCP